MALRYLNRATRTAVTSDDDSRATVTRMLAEIEAGGESAGRDRAASLDGGRGDMPLPESAFADAERRLPETVEAGPRDAHARVTGLARHRRDAMQQFRSRPVDALLTGQRPVPATTAGCDVPGGRCAHGASAVVRRATARHPRGLDLAGLVEVRTRQRADRRAAPEVAQVPSRLSRLEGTQRDAVSGGVRLAKHYPDEGFALRPGGPG